LSQKGWQGALRSVAIGYRHVDIVLLDMCKVKIYKYAKSHFDTKILIKKTIKKI